MRKELQPAMAVSGSPAGPNYVTQVVWDTPSFTRRSIAWLVDMALLVVVVLAAAAVLGLTQTRETVLGEQEGSGTITVSYIPTHWYFALLAVASALYAIPLWRRMRATLGHRLMDLRVVDAETSQALSWRQAAIRWLLLFGWAFPGMGSSISAATWLFTVPFLAWFVVLIVSTWRDARGQGIHDRVARSLVSKRTLYTVLPRKAAGTAAAPPEQRPAPAPPGPAQRSPTPKGASRGPRRSTTGRPAKD
jgi:uncharacterized RDD family membrane protein YckC